MDFINQKLARLNSPTSRKGSSRTEDEERRHRRSISASKPSRTCSYCKKAEPTSPRSDQVLKRCARCRSAQYCSRACQRADWKRGHQRTCSVGAIMVENRYLDTFATEQMVMDQLIDAYRLRVEDERIYCGRLRGRYSNNQHENNLATTNDDDDKNGVVNSDDMALQYAFQDFRNFLDLAECSASDINCINSSSSKQEDSEHNNDILSSSSPSSSTTHDTNDTDNNSASSPTPSSSSSSTPSTGRHTVLLPGWWNAEKRSYCEKLAMNQIPDRQSWSSLLHPANKDDILAHYGDLSMPMKLRLLAQRVYGSDIMGGQSE